MLDSVTQDAAEYRSTIRKLAESSSSFAALHEFVNVKRHLCQAPAGFTLLTISPEPQDEGPGSGIEFKNILSLTTLSQELGFLNVNERCCRLFFVENMCSESIALLAIRRRAQSATGVLRTAFALYQFAPGGRDFRSASTASFDYQFQPILSNCLQELQRCVEQPFSRSGVGWPDRSLVPAGGEIIPEARLSGARCHVKSDESNSRITRKARKLIPWIREGRNFEALVSARQLVTIWFGVEKKEANTWTGKKFNQVPQISKLSGYRDYPPGPTLQSTRRRLFCTA
jgi:hypothetical protein